MQGRNDNNNSENYYEYKALYFLIFSGLGVLFPYLPVYYESLNLYKYQIGILCMIPNISSFLIAPIFSILGDIFNAHYELMIGSLLTSTLSTLAVLAVSGFNSLSGIVFLGSVVRAPLTPQIDALVISTLPSKSVYGKIRLWGAVSFGIFSLVGGVLTADYSNKGFREIFYLHSFFFFLAGFILIYLVNKLQFEKHNKQKKEKISSYIKGKNFTQIPDENENKEKIGVFAALARVFQNAKPVVIFSLVVFFSGFGAGVIDSYLFIRLGQLGGSGLVMGISRFITCAAEVPMFQVAGSLQERFGVWPMMAVTQLAFVIRFIYYSLLKDPWYVLPCEMLHGLTFATMWSVSCSYANMISPPECHSTIQTLLKGLHLGFGSGMGALIGGFFYDQYGAVNLFLWSAVLSFCSFLLTLLMILPYHHLDLLEVCKTNLFIQMRRVMNKFKKKM
jgi:MFS family permease